MAELVDACVSGAHAARCAGSSPVLGTALFNRASIFNINPLYGDPENFNFWGERRQKLPVYLAERYKQPHTSCRTRSAGGEIGIHATLRG